MKATIWLALVCIGVVLAQEGKKRPTVEEKQTELRYEARYLKEILGNADANVRPPPQAPAGMSSVLVFANGYLARGRFNKNIMDLEMTFRQIWSDDRLKYSPNNIEHVTVPNDKQIWLPDTFFASAEETHKSADRHLRFVRVESDGTVTYSQRYTLKLQCEPASSSFPLKTRLSCLLKLGSYGFTVDDILYTWQGKNPLTWNQDSGAFGAYSLVDTNSSQCAASTSTGDYSCIQARLTFEGSLHEPIVHLFLPSIFLLFASWLHFWLNRKWAAPRALSAIVPFAIFASILFFLRDPQLIFVTAHEIWLLICLFLSFLSVLEFFVALHCADCGQSCGEDAETKALINDQGEHIGAKKRGGLFKNVSVLDGLSRIAFPILFVILLIIYIVVFLCI